MELDIFIEESKKRGGQEFLIELQKNCPNDKIISNEEIINYLTDIKKGKNDE